MHDPAVWLRYAPKARKNLTKELREDACEEADIACNAPRYMGWQGHKECV
jgi:hypothetical protein